MKDLAIHYKFVDYDKNAEWRTNVMTNPTPVRDFKRYILDNYDVNIFGIMDSRHAFMYDSDEDITDDGLNDRDETCIFIILKW